MEKEIQTKRFATVKQIPPLYPAFTESSIRWLIFNEKLNGFSECIRRIGRKVLIDLDVFEQWLTNGETKESILSKSFKEKKERLPKGNK